MDKDKKDFKVVYTIVERASGKRKHWLRIGAAFANKDGSLNVLLDAVPTNGQLQIRDWEPFEERQKRIEASSLGDIEAPIKALTG